MPAAFQNKILIKHYQEFLLKTRIKVSNNLCLKILKVQLFNFKIKAIKSLNGPIYSLMKYMSLIQSQVVHTWRCTVCICVIYEFIYLIFFCILNLVQFILVAPMYSKNLSFFAVEFFMFCHIFMLFVQSCSILCFKYGCFKVLQKVYTEIDFYELYIIV